MDMLYRATIPSINIALNKVAVSPQLLAPSHAERSAFPSGTPHAKHHMLRKIKLITKGITLISYLLLYDK